MGVTSTMKAWVLTAPGTEQPLSLHDRALPQPGAGEVLVKLRAASLNYIDYAMINLARLRADFAPYIPGLDGAGVVAAVGEDVPDWQPGEAVVYNPWVICGRCEACDTGLYKDCPSGHLVARYFGGESEGAFAEYIVVPARNLVAMPAHLSFAEAAALPTVLATAWQQVVERGAIREGDTVLIQGIGSGVSLAALQLAVALGGRVIVTSSSAEKLKRALAMGAGAGINYRTEDVVKRVLELTHGRGADLVVDNAGKTSLPASVQAVANRGRILTAGATSGANVAIDLWSLIEKQAALIGVTSQDADLGDAMAFVAERKLVPPVTAYPFDQLPSALELMGRGAQFGKIVLEVALS